MKKYILDALAACVAVLAPIHTVMITVGVLIIVDLVLGMWAAKKRGESISSAAMRRTISKMLVYQLCVVSGFLMEKYLIDGMMPVAKLIGGVIGVVELKSILENANGITGTDIFKQIISRLGSQNDKQD
jgi:sugar phosphate permease